MMTKKENSLKRLFIRNYLPKSQTVWYILIGLVLFSLNLLSMENPVTENSENFLLTKFFVSSIVSISWPFIFGSILVTFFLFGSDIIPILINGMIATPTLHLMLPILYTIILGFISGVFILAYEKIMNKKALS